MLLKDKVRDQFQNLTNRYTKEFNENSYIKKKLVYNREERKKFKSLTSMFDVFKNVLFPSRYLAVYSSTLGIDE